MISLDYIIENRCLSSDLTELRLKAVLKPPDYYLKFGLSNLSFPILVNLATGAVLNWMHDFSLLFMDKHYIKEWRGRNYPSADIYYYMP